MVTELIKVKDKAFYECYQDIVKTCLKDGYILPGLLSVKDVPDKYDFSEKELNRLTVSKEASERRQLMFMANEEKLHKAMSTRDMDKMRENLFKFYNEELMKFIANYPQYQTILK